jgi:flavin prenyltransferase
MRLIVAVTGASGAVYTKLLFEKLEKLKTRMEKVSVVFSENAKAVWEHELGNKDFEKYPFQYYNQDDFFSPIASGSAKYNSMVIIPCSMGTLGKIAGGISDNLITRGADVMLKERKKLILVTRETPLNLVHINNMKTITEAGGIICPAMPAFYHHPENVDELLMTVVCRVLDLCGLDIDTKRWGE